MVSVNLLGLSFDDLNVPEVVTQLLDRNPAAPFTYVVTPNADHIARLRKTPSLVPIYESAWLCLLDSHLIFNLATALGVPTPQVSTGTDVTALLLSSLHTPPMNLLRDPVAIAEARDFAVRTKAQFTLIGLGSPLQEILAQAIATQPEATGIGLCIGAGLEFCAGVKMRAPLWMQRAGLEWFHRLSRNPWRLAKRYLIADPPVLFSLVGESLKSYWPEIIQRSQLTQESKAKLK